MATIGLCNRWLRALQCSVSDVKKRDPAGHVVIRPRPSGSNVGVYRCLMPRAKCPNLYCNVPPYSALSSLPQFSGDYRKSRWGRVGGFPLQHMSRFWVEKARRKRQNINRVFFSAIEFLAQVHKIYPFKTFFGVSYAPSQSRTLIMMLLIVYTCHTKP